MIIFYSDDALYDADRYCNWLGEEEPDPKDVDDWRDLTNDMEEEHEN